MLRKVRPKPIKAITTLFKPNMPSVRDFLKQSAPIGPSIHRVSAPKVSLAPISTLSGLRFRVLMSTIRKPFVPSTSVTQPSTTFVSMSFTAAAASILSLNSLIFFRNYIDSICATTSHEPKKPALQKWLKKRHFSSNALGLSNPGPVSSALKVPDGAEVATFGAG